MAAGYAGEDEKINDTPEAPAVTDTPIEPQKKKGCASAADGILLFPLLLPACGFFMKRKPKKQKG